MKSERSLVVLHHFGLGRTIGFQSAVSDTSGGKHPESSHQLIVKSRCLRHIVVTQTKQVSGIHGAWSTHVRAYFMFGASSLLLQAGLVSPILDYFSSH